MRREEVISKWDFSFDESMTNAVEVTVPHDWTINAKFDAKMKDGPAQGFRERGEIGWYQTTLVFEKEDLLKDIQLTFGGVYENSTVFVNDIEIGGRKYGYSPFTLNISGAIKVGENRVKVKVDNRQSPVDRWYSGSGIYREVRLLKLNKKHLIKEDIQIKTVLQNDCTATIEVKTEFEGSVEVFLNGVIVLKPEYNPQKVIIKIKNPILWSAETPYLYDLTLVAGADGKVVDKVHYRVGIREFSWNEKGFFVNGKEVVLKGVCLHQDGGYCGNATPPEVYKRRLLQLKEMGCNSVRLSHHIPDEAFVDLCDELGFYLYEEAFDKWTGGAYKRYFETEWVRDLTAMVKRDRNHACIYIWGVGNEVENQGFESMVKILKNMRTLVLSLDDTRPITCAMNPHFWRDRTVDMSQIEDIQKYVDEGDDEEVNNIADRIDCMKGIVDQCDIISCNYQEQWYDDIHAAFPDKPILGTEVYQFFKGHPKQMKNFTEEIPSLVPLEKEYVIGSYIWAGFDYLGESMGYPSKGWTGAVIRTTGIPRFSYYLFQSYWQDEPMIRFAVLDDSFPSERTKVNWDLPSYVSHWDFPDEEKVVPFAIASNCDEVKVFLNGVEYFVPQPKHSQNHFSKGFLPYEIGTIEVIGLQNGVEVCSHVLRSPSPAMALKAGSDNNPKIGSMNRYQYKFDIKSVDKQGNHCLKEDKLVYCKVEGNGKIIGTDNGYLCSDRKYSDVEVPLFQGSASVYIESDEIADFKLIMISETLGQFEARVEPRVSERNESGQEGTRWGKEPADITVDKNRG